MVLVALASIALLAVGGMWVLTVRTAGGLVPLVMIAALGAGAALPGAMQWRREHQRRRLRARVGDPSAVSGPWRRLLAGAWVARDQYAAVVAEMVSSALWERLAGHQLVVDDALEQCGALARDGDLLARQLRAFHARRLRRDLRVERRRDATGRRASQLAARLDDVDRLEAHIRDVQQRLEARVHDLRTAAWRVAAVRSGHADEREPAVRDLICDLDHLAEALRETADPQWSTTVADGLGAAAGRASVARLGYDG